MTAGQDVEGALRGMENYRIILRNVSGIDGAKHKPVRKGVILKAQQAFGLPFLASVLPFLGKPAEPWLFLVGIHAM